MNQEPDRIRQDIEATRTAMVEKLEMLEARAQETVENAKTAVAHTVDLNYQVSQHPWAAVGLAMLAGYALRRIVAPTSSSKDKRRVMIIEAPVKRGNTVRQPALQTESHTSTRDSRAHEQDMKHSLGRQKEEAISLIKGVAMSAVVGLVQEMAKQALPSFVPSCKKTVREHSNGLTEGAEQCEPTANQHPMPPLHSLP
jgi:ElaB/YqjD/DUF883 family membrane-anchored ribosome-binding protein